MDSEMVMAGIGEILMDIFEDGSATLGGAPFNVAFHLDQLLSALDLGSAVMVSAVGRDHWGDSIRSSVAKASMSLDYIALDTHHPSGTASVTNNQGSVGFEIRQDVAWDHLHSTPETDMLAHSCSAVTFGSLGQRSPESRRLIQDFVAGVQGQRLYDINLRHNTTDGVPGYSKQIIADSCALASIVKMNHDELEEVAKLLGFTLNDHESDEQVWLMMERLRSEYSLDAVVVTRDSKGAWLLSDDVCFKLLNSRLPTEWVHPVGGGDAFSAGLLVGVTQAWPLECSLDLADLMATFVVQHISATPTLSEDMIHKVIEQAGKASAAKALLAAGAIQ